MSRRTYCIRPLLDCRQAAWSAICDWPSIETGHHTSSSHLNGNPLWCGQAAGGQYQGRAPCSERHRCHISDLLRRRHPPPTSPTLLGSLHKSFPRRNFPASGLLRLSCQQCGSRLVGSLTWLKHATVRPSLLAVW